MVPLVEAVATDGFVWLVVGTFLGATIRGFTGFGTALIYLPIAGTVLPPFTAIVTLIVMDFLAPLLIVPRALPFVDRGEVARLVAGSLLGLPLGILALSLVSEEVFRLTVSALALGLVAALIAGLRYAGRPGPAAVAATGGVSGFFGGAAGLAGPPVILFYMASTRPPEAIRATILVYLIAEALLVLAGFAVAGRLAAEAIWLGAVLIAPNLAGLALGAALFRPGRETLYRRVAYGVIALSALSGLPLWD